MKAKLAKAVVPAIDAMYQAVRCVYKWCIEFCALMLWMVVLMWELFLIFVVCYVSFSAFGTKVVPPKRIMKMLPELFDHPDQNVRACSKGLTIELCRWIGKDAVKNLLFDKMRDTMVSWSDMRHDKIAITCCCKGVGM